VGNVNKTHKIVKMQKLLEGDKDYNIGKLQEILERAEKRHTLEDLGIYGHRQNYGKNKTFNLDRRRLRPIFP